MIHPETGPTRESRLAAKHRPHRSEDRFFAAKTAARHACEELTQSIRKSHIHDVMKSALLMAVRRAENRLQHIAPTSDHPGAEVKALTKEVGHLQLAEIWIAAGDRVMTRLTSAPATDARAAVEEAQDRVIWCVKADRWNGDLTVAVSDLQRVVQKAEVHASRVAG
jgi:hypothetical protein